MRRYLIIAAVAVALIGAAVLVYIFVFSSSGGVAVSQTPSGGATLPSAGASGGTVSPINGSSPTLASSTPTAAVRVSARLVKIAAGPVVPAVSLVDLPAANASSSADVRVGFIERESGNIYSYLTNEGSLTRTSNRTLPGIEDAYWLPDGVSAFVQYLSGSDLSTINTYSLDADGSAGFFLAQDLAGLAVSSSSVLALASGVNGSSAALLHLDGSQVKQAFTTPLSSLRTQFAGKSQYLAFTKPAASLAGDAYLVSAAGAFSRIAGPLPGLVALASPSGKWALVSYDNGTLALELVNTITGAATALPVGTIADKCAWAADDSAVYCGVPQNPPTNASYPDDWYQGAVAFSDRIWKIDVTGRYAELVLDFSATTNTPLDVESIAVDPAQSTLVFVNKNDGSLWSYEL